MSRFDAVILTIVVAGCATWAVFSPADGTERAVGADARRKWVALDGPVAGRPSHLAGIGLSIITLTLFGPARLRVFPRSGSDSVTAYALKRLFLLGLTAAAFVVAVKQAPFHDYVDHLKMWEAAWAGDNPWRPDLRNAYGPLFNAIAPLFAADRYGPKILFVTAGCLTAVWIIGLRGGGWRWFLTGVGLTFCLPMFWLYLPLVGMHDILCAVGVLVAVRLQQLNIAWAAGVALGLATLFKFYPAFALPAVVLGGGRVSWRVAGGWVVTVAVGMAAGYAVWGPAIISPFTMSAGRESKMLSVFRFLRSEYSPLGLIVTDPNLDRYDLPCMTAAATAIAGFCYLRKVGVVPAALAGMVAVLACYKVGHAQFQIVPLSLLVYWYATELDRFMASRSLRAAAICYVSFLAFVDLVYIKTVGFYQGPWSLIRSSGGAVMFPLAAWLTLATLRAAAAPRAKAVVSDTDEPEHGHGVTPSSLVAAHGCDSGDRS